MPSGNKLGTLCIISPKARTFGADQSALLNDLSKIVINELISQQAATQDVLTGIYNRRGFDMLAKKTIANCARYGWKTTLIYFDLNKFKEINDTYGHQTGDVALTSFTQLLTSIVRDSDIIARLGGDEFVVMLMSTDIKSAFSKIESFMKELQKFNLESSQPFQLSASYGAVEYSVDKHSTVEELICEADRLMYVQKQKGKA